MKRQVVVGSVFLLLVAGGVVALLGGVLGRRPPPSTARPSAESTPDPRLSYAGPYRNIHPDVPYVGDARCADCHPDKVESFRRHPMGRSLLPIAAVADESYETKNHNPFSALHSLFQVERRDGRVWHRQVRKDRAGRVVYELRHEALYAIGSGNHGHSYLTERDGFVFQTPISWFTEKQIWDLSPGFAESSLSGRPIPADCLFCHANQVRHREQSENRYETPLFPLGCAIGCERCHGPAGRHVESSDRLDIVNPRHLPWQLREAVCEQCHLEGEARVRRRGRGLFDYRPGLPLEQFWAIYTHAVRPGEDTKAVNHVEQMYQSGCFRHSPDDRKLGCISCHDPHVRVGPAQRIAHYRQKCLACHAESACTLPHAERLQRSPRDSCIDCHMPRFATSDIAHAASTDHRILRSANRSGAAEGPPHPAIGMLIQNFYQDRLPANDPEEGRDLGWAMVNLAGLRSGAPPPYLEKALALLERALQHAPRDEDAWELKGRALVYLNRPSAALAAYQTVLERQPDRENALAGAAAMSQNLQQAETALNYGRQLVQLNPYDPRYRRNLVQLLIYRQAWDEAGPHCQAWIGLDPASTEARQLWVRCLLKDGKVDEARAEFARIEALEPADLPALRQWFAQQAR